MARHERQQFLVAQRVTHLRGIALYGKHATHDVAVEERNAQPRAQLDALARAFDLTRLYQPRGFGEIDQTRSALPDHVLCQATLVASRRGMSVQPFIDVLAG